MKHIHKIRNSFLLLCFLAAGNFVIAQEDSTKPEITINIHHFTVNNSFQYLMIEAKMKVDKRWQPVKGRAMELYLDSNKAENLVAKTKTDSNGKANAIIPASLKTLWDASSSHKFIAVAADGTTAEAEIAKAKILIDTSNTDGTKSVNVQVMKWDNNDWAPAKDVEVKIGIRRLGGDLKIGEEETYTTDSLGQVAGEFKRDSLPGNEKGDLILVAKVEDNDSYGSLSIEKTVPWGVYIKHADNFGQRTLWGARGKAPIWLMFMAYSIIAFVWGVLVYLIIQVVKIAKLGKEETITRKKTGKTTMAAEV
jgi:hypothetical protein